MKNKKFVITGGIVQEYRGHFDFLKKKYGLEPYINFLLNFWDFILLQVKSSILARELLNLYQQFWAYLEKLLDFFSMLNCYNWGVRA
ncbi:MAG: hypothetical protein DRQ88_00165 [Epsilonproteobacteria bacterium]|nr:MAG: hypothetical protein DRQ89_06090 [Campylobacterota bacterium]RLA68050.1 MAG: hypothetical protein DRQ88_00165 [Campylobacterota bacterium]